MNFLKYFFILTSIFCLLGQVHSQNDKIKWKEITKEEIDLETYGDAPAVITYTSGQMYFDINANGQNLYLFQSKHVRLKILNEEGLKYAKVKFMYHDMSCERYQGENSFIFKGYTYNISNSGEIKKTRFKNKYLTHKDSSNCHVLAEADFQDVKIGSIIEYKVVTPTLQFIRPDNWEFQKEIPVIYSSFKARVPRYFKYSFILKNIENIYHQDSAFYDKVINYRFKYGNKYYNKVLDLSGKEYTFVNKNMESSVDIHKSEQIKIHLLEAKTDPGDYAWKKLTKALAITTWDDYYSRTPNQRKMLNYPTGYYMYYLPTWKEFNENLLLSEKFGMATIKFWDSKELIDSITSNAKNETDKSKAIYNFVRENMNWNGKYSIFADVTDGFFKKLYAKTGAKVKLNNVGDFFNEGEGSSSEINFVLMHLLHKAKIEVYPVLINTVNNTPVDKDIPVKDQFISVIALVIVDGETILLDAVEKNSNFSEISDKYPLDQMFIIRKEEYGWLISQNNTYHK